MGEEVGENSKMAGIVQVEFQNTKISVEVRSQNLYYLKGRTVIVQVASAISEADNSRLWHYRLGHIGKKSLQTLCKHGLLKEAKSGKVEFYKHCVLGKKTKVKFGTTIHRTRDILDYVHTNIWGPTNTASLGGRH
ncbi:uncharacterized protein LOC109821732 [Asparagus officinalis]|uniref:uncharacterized protein LOC109821732 n=1 Tax=Asparagus officinalis TaxID=4686 RepID=UPI00098DFE9E|nr:uncharacterized protein LOC109821732 [Asparagus officinalis]